jgi:hypothetical protein
MAQLSLDCGLRQTGIAQLLRREVANVVDS